MGCILLSDTYEFDHSRKYRNITDEEIIEYVKNGEIDALEFLINKYRQFVRAKVKTYFLIGADQDDVFQEGMIGLYKAIRDYNGDSSFRSFAELCITRQIITAIKTATRQKHIPLNSYVSLYKPVFDDGSERTLMDYVTSSKAMNPEELVINQEEVDSMEARLSEVLSPLERKVLPLFLDGKSYKEISIELSRSVKAIDNALTRVKGKLEKYLETKDLLSHKDKL
jgi:RNA polymerase sporulation-specific sigma factor